MSILSESVFGYTKSKNASYAKFITYIVFSIAFTNFVLVRFLSSVNDQGNSSDTGAWLINYSGQQTSKNEHRHQAGDSPNIEIRKTNTTVFVFFFKQRVRDYVPTDNKEQYDSQRSISMKFVMPAYDGKDC
jgi:hypothetical protein